MHRYQIVLNTGSTLAARKKAGGRTPTPTPTSRSLPRQAQATSHELFLAHITRLLIVLLQISRSERRASSPPSLPISLLTYVLFKEKISGRKRSVGFQGAESQKAGRAQKNIGTMSELF